VEMRAAASIDALLLLLGGAQALAVPTPPEEVQAIYESGIVPVLLTPVALDPGLPQIKHEIDESVGVVQSELQSIQSTIQAAAVRTEVQNTFPQETWEEVLSDAVNYVDMANEVSNSILTDASEIANEPNVLLSDLSDLFAAYGDEKAAPIEETGDAVMAVRAELIDTLITTPLDNLTEAFTSSVDTAEEVATTPMVAPTVMTAATTPVAATLGRAAQATFIAEYFPEFYAWLEPILTFLSELSVIVSDMGAELETVLRKYWSDLNDEIMSSWVTMYIKLWTRAVANFDPMVALNDWLYSRGAAAAAPLDAVSAALDDAVELNVADDYVADALEVNDMVDGYIDAVDGEVDEFIENPEAYVVNLLG